MAPDVEAEAVEEPLVEEKEENESIREGIKIYRE